MLWLWRLYEDLHNNYDKEQEKCKKCNGCPWGKDWSPMKELDKDEDKKAWPRNNNLFQQPNGNILDEKMNEKDIIIWFDEIICMLSYKQRLFRSTNVLTFL